MSATDVNMDEQTVTHVGSSQMKRGDEKTPLAGSVSKKSKHEDGSVAVQHTCPNCGNSGALYEWSEQAPFHCVDGPLRDVQSWDSPVCAKCHPRGRIYDLSTSKAIFSPHTRLTCMDDIACYVYNTWRPWHAPMSFIMGIRGNARSVDDCDVRERVWPSQYTWRVDRIAAYDRCISESEFADRRNTTCARYWDCPNAVELMATVAHRSNWDIMRVVLSYLITTPLIRAANAVKIRRDFHIQPEVLTMIGAKLFNGIRITEVHESRQSHIDDWLMFSAVLWCITDHDTASHECRRAVVILSSATSTYKRKSQQADFEAMMLSLGWTVWCGELSKNGMVRRLEFHTDIATLRGARFDTIIIDSSNERCLNRISDFVGIKGTSALLLVSQANRQLICGSRVIPVPPDKGLTLSAMRLNQTANTTLPPMAFPFG